jgi:hypothetical protein
MSVQSTAAARRKIAIEALSRELDGSEPASGTARLGALLTASRPMAASADIDGLVSATMLASVAPGWEIVAFQVQSSRVLVHQSVAASMPADLVAVDLFSVNHDSISNHVVKYGSLQAQLTGLRAAFRAWDAAVDAAGRSHLHAVPALWAGTEGSYEDAGRPTSSKYKYPFGTAQILLAMLEASGHAPKFFDRHYLPWLVANCDGGVSTYTKYAWNARVWWPVMAGAVGPASLTEQVFRLVDDMRPHEFADTVNALDRERAANNEPAWLNDDWNLADTSTSTIERALTWLCDLTGWRDPVRGGVNGLQHWVTRPVSGSGEVYLKGNTRVTAATEAAAVATLAGAPAALNANFYHGGFSGSRFNWAGGW